MLDVHPPHHPTHSWRDFFIHIATIVVGLIIAVGIEQLVELVHHHRDRFEIEERLRREAESNIAPLDASRRRFEQASAWDASLMELIRKTPEQAGLITFAVPPPLPPGQSQTVQRAAWSVAKANGTLALLPEATQEIFDRVDWVAAQEDLTYLDVREALREENAVEKVAGTSFDPGSTARFPAAQRNSLVSAMAKLVSAEEEERFRLAACEAANMAIRENPTSALELQKVQRRIFATLHK